MPLLLQKCSKKPALRLLLCTPEPGPRDFPDRLNHSNVNPFKLNDLDGKVVEQNGVAVGQSTSDDLGTDQPGSPRSVVDDDGRVASGGALPVASDVIEVEGGMGEQSALDAGIVSRKAQVDSELVSLQPARFIRKTLGAATPVSIGLPGAPPSRPELPSPGPEPSRQSDDPREA